MMEQKQTERPIKIASYNKAKVKMHLDYIKMLEEKNDTNNLEIEKLKKKMSENVSR